MDLDTLITGAIGISGLVGGFVGGRRTASTHAVGIAVDTVELLQVQVGTLVEQNVEKDKEITNLQTRVDILEEMVTQKAEVEAVKVAVDGVRDVVDAIATKVGA